ncbi:hypothetical protein LEP1GSC166_1075 [Leptospira kirschneri]|nr:hypothetical protein LEP1GSC166_1075 [Leptospira kirschneri]
MSRCILKSKNEFKVSLSFTRGLNSFPKNERNQNLKLPE